MTIIFQIAVVIAICIASVFFIRGGGARYQAMRRILMVAFMLAAASSVFFPQVWTWAANLLGIGRGADLLLYLLVLVFFGFVASTYRRFRTMEKEVTELARQLGLANAMKPTTKPESDQEESNL